MKSVGVEIVGWFVAWLGCGGAVVAWAPDKPEPPSAAASSNAPKEREVLLKLVGKWKIDEEYPATKEAPKGAQGKGDATLRTMGDDHVVGEYSSRCKEMGTDVDAMVAFTWDTEAGTYRRWWFDNYGGAYESLGKYDARSNALVFTREYKPADATEKVTDQYTYTFKDEDTIVLKMEYGTSPTTHELMLTTTYSRKGKKPANEEEAIPPSTPSKAKRAIGR